ncbi:MAG: Gfo/Idh/MocA family oxidoreductase [Bryobacteraceae bacterium]|nr:Gfo/Idh/MocA family oxidoreductase [Bryobacteraceae bacterium]
MLHWVVVGIGDIAVKRVIPAIRNEPRSELYGVVTRNPGKGRDYGGHVWTDLDEALADPQVNAVYIATPVALHAPQTIAALAAGKHVLCEKPVALNYAEARGMVDAAQAAGRVLGIAYYRRMYPKVHRAKELLSSGAIGRPVLAEISCHDWFNAEDGRRGWLVDPQMAGGGPLFDIASHRIDLLNFLFGQPGSVAAQRSSVVHRRQVEDSATVLIEYPDGVRGVVDVRWHCRVGRDEFRITGTDGVMDLTPLNGARLLCNGRGEDLPPHPNLHYPCVANFADHVLESKPLLAGGESSIWTDWVTEQARR